MAEGVGFEPPVGDKPTLDFESSALNRTQPSLHSGRKLIRTRQLTRKNLSKKKLMKLVTFPFLNPYSKTPGSSRALACAPIGRGSGIALVHSGCAEIQVSSSGNFREANS